MLSNDVTRKLDAVSKAAPLGSSDGAKSSSFPKTNARVVGYWLLGSAASVFGIVVFGGLTRLTESGYVKRVRWSLHRGLISAQPEHH
jgi:cytochrome c oxidase assembly protein subunit 15